MTELELGVWSVGLVVGGPVCFFSAFPRLRLWRELGDTPQPRPALRPWAGWSSAAQPKKMSPPNPAPERPALRVVALKVEEERHYTDSKGNTRTEWVSIMDRAAALSLGGCHGPRVVVEPPRRRGAGFAGAPMPDGGAALGGAPPPGPQAAFFSPSFGRRLRYTEWRIEVSRPLVALGFMKPGLPGSDGQPRPTLGHGPEGEPFFLATHSPDEAKRDVMLGLATRLALGAILFAIGLGLSTVVDWNRLF